MFVVFAQAAFDNPPKANSSIESIDVWARTALSPQFLLRAMHVAHTRARTAHARTHARTRTRTRTRTRARARTHTHIVRHRYLLQWKLPLEPAYFVGGRCASPISPAYTLRN